MDSAGGPRATNAGAAVPKWAFRAMLDAGYEMPVEEVDYPAGREPPQSEYEVFCLYPRSASLYELAAPAAGPVVERYHQMHRRITRDAWNSLLRLSDDEWAALWAANPNRDVVARAVDAWRREGSGSVAPQ